MAQDNVWLNRHIPFRGVQVPIKDATNSTYRDLALYYDVQGRLVIAPWDSWEVYTSGEDIGMPNPSTYVREKAVEFRYDNTDARQRYMMRALDEEELPDIVPLASPLGQWVEYSGSAPFLDAKALSPEAHLAQSLG